MSGWDFTFSTASAMINNGKPVRIFAGSLQTALSILVTRGSIPTHAIEMQVQRIDNGAIEEWPFRNHRTAAELSDDDDTAA